MSYFLEVTRPSNGLHLATFSLHPDYYYRLADGNRLRLRVDYAWCHRCEQFIEAERLYTLAEIQTEIDELSAAREKWDGIDAEIAAHYAKQNREMPREFAQHVRYDTWVTALSWRENRKTPAKCLRCGSFFAITLLERGKEVPHPCGEGTVILQLGGHADLAQFPEPVYFDGEGMRIA